MKNAKLENVIPWALFIISLSVYYWTAPRAVTFEDNGAFIITAFKFGVPHPPGYPLFPLLSYPFTLLPLDSLPLRVNLFSSFFGALTIVFFYLWGKTFFKSSWLMALMALSFAFSKTFWSQSLIAEVYTLNTTLCFAFLLWCRRGQSPFVGGLIFALGMSNHWPLFISFVFGALVIFPRLKKKQFLIFLGASLLAVLPYLFIIWRSRAEGVFSFVGRLDDPLRFYALFFRKIYGSVDDGASTFFANKIHYSLWILKEFFQQNPLYYPSSPSMLVRFSPR